MTEGGGRGTSMGNHAMVLAARRLDSPLSVSALEAATAPPARSHFGHPGGCRFAEKWEASTAVVASSALAAPWERTQRAGAFSPVGSPAVHVSSMGRRTDDPGCFQGAASA